MKTVLRSILLLVVAGGMQVQAQYTSVNQTLQLTGSGFLSVPNTAAYNSALASGAEMSIDAWVMPTSFASGYMTIVGNDYTVSYWLGTTPTGKLRYYPWGGLSFESNGSIPLNQWSHVAISFASRTNTLQFFINGVLDRTVTTPQGNITTSNADLRIGADRQSGAPSYYWHGRLDEVRIWHEAIDFSTAIGALFRVPHAMLNGRHGRYLAGCWRMNGSGWEELNVGQATLAGTGSYSAATPLPTHYDRICAVFNNGMSPTGAPIHDYFALPGALAPMQFVSDYTLECWVKRAASGGGTTYQTLLYKGSDYFGQRTWGLQINKTTNKLRFLPTGNPSDVLESTANIPVGQWTHVAAKFDQVSKGLYTATVYVNGVASGTRNYTASGISNQLDILIGRGDPSGATSGSNTGFAGSMDEIRFWSVVRSDDEIADNYRREFNGPVSGLLAAYRLDGDIYDLSGNHLGGSYALPTSSDLYFLNASDLPSEPSITVLSPNGGETWNIGSTRSITWTSSGLQNVRIELSRDGGATYTALTPKTGTAVGSYNWTVTAPATTTARVRITTVTPTDVEDVSNAHFTIAEPSPVLSVDPKALVFGGFQGGALPPPQKLHLTNVGGQTMTWSAAVGSGGWLSVSPSSGAGNLDSLEVSIISNALPTGTYTEDIVFTGNMSNTGLRVPVTYRVSTVPLHSVEGRIMLGNTPLPLIPVELNGASSHATNTDANGMFYFTQIPQGDYTLRPVSAYYDFTPPERTYNPLSTTVTNADFTARAKQSTVRIHYKSGWNLISLPVIPNDMNPTAIFPTHMPPAYKYAASTGYEIVDKMEPGVGYWVKFPIEDSVDVAGAMVASIAVPVNAALGGWNMIGTAAGPTQVAMLMTVPTAIIRAVYAYDPIAGYVALGPTDALRPGNAYFMKVLANGTLTINAAPFTGGLPPASLSIPSVRYPLQD